MNQKGLKAAYGARRPGFFVARRAVNRLLRALARPLADVQPDYLCLWPPIRSEAEFADLAARVRWYLPGIDLPVHALGAEKFKLDPAAAPHMDPELVVEGTFVRQRPAGRPLHLLHDVHVRSLARAGSRIRRSIVIDADLSYTSGQLGYQRLMAAFDTSGGVSPESTLPRLLERRLSGGSAFVLGTGPSAALVDPVAVTSDIRIICNSAVRNLQLVEQLRPTAITFADPVFHFGPSRYAAAFRRDVLRALEVCDALVVIPESFAPLLAAHCPSIVDRLVSVRMGGGLNVPTAADPRACETGNVLTQLMLPIAFALADHVEVAGCDGRKPSESYFWQHSPLTQYGDELMRTVFDAHPAFFRHRSYTDYYDRHCEQTERLINLGETQGKSVRGVTPSWIPALARRGAAEPSG